MTQNIDMLIMEATNNLNQFVQISLQPNPDYKKALDIVNKTKSLFEEALKISESALEKEQIKKHLENVDLLINLCNNRMRLAKK